jgi:hypothetical protein
MNEVNLDLVISKQIFFTDFLEELVLYIEEKTIRSNSKVQSKTTRAQKPKFLVMKFL